MPKPTILVLAVITTFTGGYLMWEQPWLSECEKLDRRCQTIVQSGSNLRGAMACGLIGLFTLGGRSEEKCREINKAFKNRRSGKNASSSTKTKREAEKPKHVKAWTDENIRETPNGKIIGRAKAGDTFEVLDSSNGWWWIELPNGDDGYIWKRSVYETSD